MSSDLHNIPGTQAAVETQTDSHGPEELLVAGRKVPMIKVPGTFGGKGPHFRTSEVILT